MRYVTKSAWHGGWYQQPDAKEFLAKTIHECEPMKTGLIDASGNPIYRMADEIGFIRRDNE